jgi:thiamine-phosphate pyrophosphorylase
MGRPTPIPRLHVIANVRPGFDVLAFVEAALRGGAPCIQLRDKHGSDRACHELAAAVAAQCHEAGAICIIDDRVDIALAVGACVGPRGAPHHPV